MVSEMYEFQIPDSVPAHLWPAADAEPYAHDRFFELAEKLGLSQDQVSGLLSYFYEGITQADQQRQADEERAARHAEEALSREWGREHDVNVEFARKAVATIFGEEAGAALAGTKLEGGRLLGNEPGFVKAMASLGRSYATVPGNPETVTHPANHAEPPMSEAAQEVKMQRDEAVSRIDEIYALQDSDPVRFRSEATQRELAGLFETVHGTEPGDGSEDIAGDGVGAVQVGAPEPGEREGVADAA